MGFPGDRGRGANTKDTMQVIHDPLALHDLRQAVIHTTIAVRIRRRGRSTRPERRLVRNHLTLADHYSVTAGQKGGVR